MADDLTWMPAWQIRELIAKREVSPVEVMQHFLGRIEEHDSTLHSFCWVDPDALDGAKQAEAAVLRGDDLGPLHGIPISVKQSIPFAGQDLLPWRPEPTAGTTAPAARDGVIVERLRDAGAIVMGINSMMGTGVGSPYLGHYDWEHEARNPWDPTRVPGWSSSGGAAAAVAALLPMTIGGDGGGSTRLPAAYSGVVGMHPTPNLVPTVDYQARQLPSLTNSYGPLSRNVVDNAIGMRVIAGPDGRDFTCNPADVPDYLATIDDGVSGMRMAWTDDYGFTDMYALEESPRVIVTVRAAAEGFNSLGATVEHVDDVWEDFFPAFGGTGFLFGGKAAMENLPSLELWETSLDSRKRNWDHFRELFRTHDVLLSVTSQLTARTVEEWNAIWIEGGSADRPYGSFGPTYCSHTMMFNLLGFPAISVPCGFVDGLPVGLQIVAWPGNEARIYSVANAFQQAFPRDERPQVS
jgi:aspartyl-tRNA(Asn)/glutamyl-tRNA(Gln) amidotransferase subunit A